MSKLFLLAVALALSGCAYRPPQSGFYCLGVPTRQADDVRRIAEATAKQLSFEFSEDMFALEPDDVRHTFKLRGKGVSLLVATSMISSKIVDEFGNAETHFDPGRYSVQAVKVGWVQNISFEEVLGALAGNAHSSGMTWAAAPSETGCSI